MNDLTTDKMIAYLEKAMKEKHHPDWLGWVGQNKVFKYKTIPIKLTTYQQQEWTNAELDSFFAMIYEEDKL